jgi:hypothetical protein
MVSKYDGASVEILAWEKFNPRKDLKATSWFRLQNSLFEDPNFFDFSHAELMVWIYLLSIASKKQTGVLRMSIAHAERIGRLKSSEVESAFEKLVELQCVQITLSVRHADDTQTSRPRTTTNERTDETPRDETNETVPTGSSPDRALNVLIWNAYADEYSHRYQVHPTRNAKVNAQISQLGKRLGADAVEVVRFYVRHNKAYYVQAQHMVDPMLKDAESLHTQWQRGAPMLGSQAREIERVQHSSDTWDAAARIVNERRQKNEAS